MQLSMRIDPADEKRLMDLLTNTPDRLAKEVEIAINATAKMHVKQIADKVNDVLNITLTDLKKSATVKRKAKKFQQSAWITVNHIERAGLKHFGANHVKKGVTYRIERGSKRSLIVGAFMGTKPGVRTGKLNGHVFKRKGKSRLPIVKLRGVSMWKYYLEKNLGKWSEKKINDRLKYELGLRVRAVLHRQGKI